MRVLARLEDNRAEAVLRAVKQNSVPESMRPPSPKSSPSASVKLITTGCPITAGRSGSSAFRLLTHYSVDVAHGLVLLYGIGTKALLAICIARL